MLCWFYHEDIQKIFLVFFLVGIVSKTSGQIVFGGVVRDSFTGEVIENAKVRIDYKYRIGSTMYDPVRKYTETNQEGRFEFRNLPGGNKYKDSICISVHLEHSYYEKRDKTVCTTIRKHTNNNNIILIPIDADRKIDRIVTEIQEAQGNKEKIAKLKARLLEVIRKNKKLEKEVDSLGNRIKEEKRRQQLLVKKKNKAEAKIAKLKKETQSKTKEIRSRERANYVFVVLIIVITVVFLIQGWKNQINMERKKYAELEHRVRNSMENLKALVGLEKKRVLSLGIQHIKQVPNNIMQVIEFMMNTQSLLLNNKRLAFDEYIENIVNNIKESLGFPAKGIEVKCIVSDNIVLSKKKMIKVGHILYELMMNSNKYAFDGITTDPKISIEFRRKGNDTLLIYKDNGKGILSTKKGTGTKIIEGYVDSMGGIIGLESNQGVKYNISF